MNLFFFKIFSRNISRQGVFPLINIAGLAVGLTVVLLICAFVFNEYSFDRSFTHHQRIYRATMVGTELAQARAGKTSSNSPKALALALKDEIPAVEAAVRIFLQTVVVKAGETPFKVERFCWADTDFFRLFDTPFMQGSPEEVFARPDRVALSASQAKVFFGAQNPLGETLLVDNRLMEISAVYEDFPANSSFEGYHVIGDLMSAPSWINEPLWGDIGIETYCLLAPATNTIDVESGIQRLLEKNLTHQFFQIKLQSLDQIHLYSKEFSGNEFTSNQGDIGRVQLFSLLAVIILLVACINYMNLSTARAKKRSKEIGISKTFGANRRQIIAQLYAETGMMTFVSFVAAFVLASMLLPVFNLISGQVIQPDIFFNIKFLLGMLLIYVVTTFVGVFGLTAFMAEQRKKEIGIRKVLGASVCSIVRLFTDNYLRLLALSLVIALPVVWWVGSSYLENFAYRIALVWWIFAAAALITVLLTLITAGYQAIRAAMENPVKAIMNE